MNRNLKRIFFFTVLSFLIIFLNSDIDVKKQGDDQVMNKSYDKLWEEVEKLTSKGLSKSVIETVNVILKKAKDENNTNQIIKAVIYSMKFRDYTEEDAHENIINELNINFKEYKTPEKNILLSLLAEMYLQYYDKNSYKFQDRTHVEDNKSDDIKTWDLRTLFNKINELYIASLEDKDALKKIPLDNYKDFVVLEYYTKDLRPTLYDFLAHRALDYFMNDRTYLAQPAYKFELKDKFLFDETKAFSTLKIETKDKQSCKYISLLMFQDLINFHLNDKEPSALIDADLKRINFIYANSVHENKDELYFKALNDLKEKYKEYPITAKTVYEIAYIYYTKGNNYNPYLDNDLKWNKKKAFDLCDEYINKFQNSYFINNLKYLKSEILKKDISIQIERVSVPDKPILSLVKYKNVDKIYFKIIKLSKIDKDKIDLDNYSQEKLINFFKGFKSYKEFEITLPEDKDYNNHSVEIKIPELPIGYYEILAGTSPAFNIIDKNALFYTNYWVSNISYSTRNNSSDASYYVNVFDRNSGAPLSNVKVNIYMQKYNDKIRKYQFVLLDSYTSDKDGQAEIKANNKSFRIEFIKDNDWLLLNDSHYQDNPYGKYESIKTFFFTDRSIYRPGQTIYFKGLVLKSLEKKNEIMTAKKVNVQYFDVNRQLISQTELTTNEFGTFNGTFIAPTGRLNGLMYIKAQDESGSTSISVEEYKRPKFEVLFDPVKGSFKAGENVVIKGKAKAYAGSNIDNADAVYRVVRKVEFPYWYWWFWYWGYPDAKEMEITNGNLKTNDQGEFEVNFNAVPDLSISKDMLPVFNYYVYVDVTDINGETHSAETVVKVGYAALKINIDMGDQINREGKNSFEIKSLNLNDQYEPSTGNITVFKIKAPDKTYKSRYWTKPDKYLLSKEEFNKSFPDTAYSEEDIMYKWEKEKTVLSADYNTDKNKNFVFETLPKLNEGRYMLQLKTKDKFGKDIDYFKYFTVYSENTNSMPYVQNVWFAAIKNKVQPGEDAVIAIGSSDKDVNMLYEIENEHKIISKSWININNEKKIIKIPVEEKHRGNFTVHITFIKNNRYYSYPFLINVPWSNKDLKVEFETFRNKLQPGQKDQWKIKISGNNKDKILSEIAATLYDASLNSLKPHDWYFDIYPLYNPELTWSGYNSFRSVNFYGITNYWNDYYYYYDYYYSHLNWFGFNFAYSYYLRGEVDDVLFEKKMSKEELPKSEDTPSVKDKKKDGDDEADSNLISEKETDKKLKPEEKTVEKKGDNDIQIRKNFNETAFFYPELNTDENGNVIVSFTIPEALTRWKLLGFSHTKNLEYALFENELVTQKDLMVMPNMPRFLRENDKIIISTKISNISEKDLTGISTLKLFDALTMKPVDDLFLNKELNKNYAVKKGLSTAVSWEIKIPEGVKALTYRITAKADNFSDGEESTLPILTNSMLVTESIPLPVRKKGEKIFKFEKLINSGNSKTLRHEKITLEFTSNPAWYAVQSLPYLMEYPYECSEQVFSRFYANSIATEIANSSPKIKAVFDSWKNTDALLSNLEKNQELKSLLLEETPWVLDSQDETQRKKRVGLLFDLNKMSNELDRALTKLKKMQYSNGGFPWFDGLPDDWYITQHIVSGIGHLQKLKIKNAVGNNDIDNIIKKAIPYIDNRMREDYEDLIKYKVNLNEDNIGYMEIHYLYARSFYKEIPVSARNKIAFEYWKTQSEKYWLNKGKYMQGMIAIALNRFDNKNKAMDIIKSLKENSITNEELGMYYKDNIAGYYWYQAPIETQALLIEAFYEVANDIDSVEDMKVWLLKQKQTQNWRTTKATTDACYALLIRGTDWLSKEELIEIVIGDIKIDPANSKDIQAEQGTGYFKTSWNKNEIKPEMGNIKIIKKQDSVSWGALYWQYFEQLDKITPHETPLKLKKTLYLQVNTDKGPVLKEITKNNILKVGDLVKVRIELKVDRNMEYIHMKDMRASAFEPTNVISTYKYQDGLWYYETTKDASTNFFFPVLFKGSYVFEYPLRVTHKGNFSNGITTIQCMYAPEFTSHSEGIRVEVK